MATNTLTDQNISDTYVGLLHGQGEQLPITGQVLMYDGNGNSTSIRVGRLGQGFSVIGTLSSDVLSVAGVTYPTADGTANQYMKTDGSGTISFDSISDSDLPSLIPNPASTYKGVSAITVDSKGRVTNVVTAESGSIVPVYLYETPIAILETSGSYNSNINVAKANMPSDATYALLKIHGEVCWSTAGPGTVSNLSVYINGVRAFMTGCSQLPADNHGHGEGTISIWFAKMTGNEITVQVSREIGRYAAEYSSYASVDLLGYASYNTLSNP